MKSSLSSVFRFTLLCALVVSLFGSAAAVTPVRAAGIVVDNDSDSVFDNDNCSLREAILAANTDTPVDECAAGDGADTISIPFDLTISLSSQLPIITSDITINGNGANNAVIQANINKYTATYRIFEVDETGSLTLDGFTLRNGYCANACYLDGVVDNISNKGGAIHNSGTLTVMNSAFIDNVAYHDVVEGGDGGAIYNLGTLTVHNSYFSGNEAEWGAGVFNAGSATAEIVNNTFYLNFASENGAGIYNGGTLTVRNSTLFSNEAGEGKSGAGIYDQDGTLTLYNTLLSGNYQKTSLTENDCRKGGSGALSGSHNLIEANDAIAPCVTPSSTTADPLLIFPLDTSGPTLSIAIGSDSPAYNAGSNAECPAADQRGVARPQGANCDIGAFETEITTATLRSNATRDGWLLESTETSSTGGTRNNDAATLRIGDDAANKQYRAILSFNTASIPEDAVITWVTLRVKRQGVAGGGNPINIFKGFMVDIKEGNFGNSALQNSDFQAAGSTTLSNYKPALSVGWYDLNITPASAQINLAGVTQIRLRFKLGDNNNSVANYLRIFSGDVGAASRPQLIVEYYIP